MSFIQRLAFAPAAITLAIGAFAPSGPANAVVIQGFESGLGGVLVFGDAGTRGKYGPGVGGVSPTEGISQLLLTTFSIASDGSNLSGTNALSLASLAAATGISSATIRNSNVPGLAGNGFEGSAYQITLTLGVGDTFRFNYNFMTVEDPLVPPFHADFAFFNVAGAATSYRTLADANSLLLTSNPALTNFSFETTYQTVNFTALTAGSYTFTIGVMDAGAVGSIQSGLLLDNIQLIAIPEPSTLALAGLGLLGVAGILRQRRLA